MRGEHIVGADGITAVEGSSPHARGALAAARLQLEQLGIIPACAGSTPTLFSPGGHQGDHPRMRGEHSAPHRPRDEGAGSSPHARGAL